MTSRPRDVDAGDLAEHDVDVLRARQNAADRRGDVGGRKSGGRDLIEQRLEQVIVVLVDDRDVERRSGKRLCGGQSAESGSDDDDAGIGHGCGILHMESAGLICMRCDIV